MAAATSASVPKRPSGIMRFHFIFEFLRERGGHRRVNEAGSDGVHGDVARSDFDGDSAGEADQAGFRRDVVRLAGVAGLRDDRSEIDDAAGALLEHRAEGLLDAEMRAGEVGAQHGVPVFEFHAQGERVARDGGVVHQNVELAEFREHLLEAGFHLRGIGYVHGNGQRAPPAASISATSVASFSVLRAATATFAPATTSASAVERPMPCDAPVTRATLSWSENIGIEATL